MPDLMQESKRLLKLRDRKAKIVTKMEGILDSTDESGELSEEQETEYSALETELESVNKAIKREESLQDEERSMEARPNINGDTAEQAAARIGNARDAAANDPMRGFRNPQEFLNSVLTASQTHGSSVDQRLRPLSAAGSDEHSTFADPHGGFLVPEGMSPQFLTTGPETDLWNAIMARVTQVPMATPTVKFNARTDKDHSSSVSGGLTVSRRGESNAVSSSQMTLEQVKLEATGLFGLAYATEELLDRSAMSFAALLEAGFRDEFTSKGVQELLTGTGTGEPEGVQNAPCKIAVTKESMQTADTIDGINILKMRARVWNYGNAIWIANHDAYVELMQAHIESDNNAGLIKVYQPSLQDDRPDMLLGRPIFYSEYAETLGDEGDLYCVDFSQVLYGVMMGMQRAESVHVRFTNHERTFKFWIENDARSWWRSALTPKNSSTTLSPIVTLAERA